MDDHGPVLNFSHAGPDIISIVLGSMPLRKRFNCALVCKAWAEAATAATCSIILEHRMQDVSGLQAWLEKHGNRLEVLQLHAGYDATLTALPCCAKLQDLLLHRGFSQTVSIAGRTWSDIASATKLTSINLTCVQTASQQADVVAALTALPNLKQLTWYYVRCSGKQAPLSDSSLLQHLMRLTSVELRCVTAAALQHLGSLAKLQHLNISGDKAWTAAGCPGLQELKALTSLQLSIWPGYCLVDLPSSISQLTALRQLGVYGVIPTALNQLQVLTGLTQLCVWHMRGMPPESPPLKLPGLQHLELEQLEHLDWFFDNDDVIMPTSFLASCTQLQYLKLQGFEFTDPGSLVPSTMLQHLELHCCNIIAADGAADPVSWDHVFPGPGRLPHLTSLQLFSRKPALQQADIAAVVACCSNLQVLHLATLQDSFAPTLARLRGLTSLQLDYVHDEECSAMVQLKGLRQLMVQVPSMSAVGLRHLVALNQLTSLRLGTFDSWNKVTTLAALLMKDNLPGYAHALFNEVCGKAYLYGVRVCVRVWMCVCGGGGCCPAAPVTK